MECAELRAEGSTRAPGSLSQDSVLCRPTLEDGEMWIALPSRSSQTEPSSPHFILHSPHFPDRPPPDARPCWISLQEGSSCCFLRALADDDPSGSGGRSYLVRPQKTPRFWSELPEDAYRQSVWQHKGPQPVCTGSTSFTRRTTKCPEQPLSP